MNTKDQSQGISCLQACQRLALFLGGAQLAPKTPKLRLVAHHQAQFQPQPGAQKSAPALAVVGVHSRNQNGEGAQ